MTSTSPNKRRQRPRLARWVALALLVHAELALVIGLAAFFWVPRNADMLALMGGKGGEAESIDISTLDDETSKKILAELDKQEEEAKEEERKKEEEAIKSPGQVVDLPKPNEEKRPDKARFAAEYDSSVAKEMKKYGEFNKSSKQGMAQGNAEQTRPEVPPTPPSQKTAPTPPGALAMRAPVGQRGRQGPPGNPGESAPAVQGMPGESVEAPPDQNGDLSPPGRQGAAQSSGGVPASGMAPSPRASKNGAPPSLIPSEQQIARAIGAGTQDHLRDIDDGEETALNAKKWKFASFFNRVKERVRDHWRPAEEYRRRDPTGSIYGQKDRYTLLRVQLKPDGSLANVALENPSGVEFLDDEAIEAFKQAQPFPNPPKQLVENSGLIEFKFGFFFELSGSPHMKIFKYGN